jgi:hypothetical protein
MMLQKNHNKSNRHTSESIFKYYTTHIYQLHKYETAPIDISILKGYTEGRGKMP